MRNSLHAMGRDLGFLGLAALLLVLLGCLLRTLLLIHNAQLAGAIPGAVIAQSYITGLRFDLIVTCWILLPVLLLLPTPTGLGSRRLVRLWLISAGLIIIFLGILELDFYKVFHARLNSLVFQYFREDPSTVSKMVWNGFPVVRYLLAVALIWSSYCWLLARADRFSHHSENKRPHSDPFHTIRTLVTLGLLILCVGGARGSFSSGPPLRWGDAVTSEYTFTNHLGLNGTFTLVKSAADAAHTDLEQDWINALPRKQSLALTRSLLLTSGDELLAPDTQPVLRRHTPGHNHTRPMRNMVLIIMESFAGHAVGALGNTQGITPEFDALAREGLLFRRFFSNGTHTHQGMYATVACFPNLPGHEYLMQEQVDNRKFSGLPTLFPGGAGHSAYLYNGDFRWDNQAGFFRHLGMDRFIGRDDIGDPGFMDAVWGVSDHDLFNEAEKELDRLAESGPFYAIIQTLSNHVPFSLPKPLPVEPVADGGELSEHLTAMRYADWALGQFFRQIRNKPYYDETLFVLVGDHGFASDHIVSAIDLNRFRVPMLLIAPGIVEAFGPVSDRVGSQVDIVPTAMSLMGRSFTHQCWGRDLLSLPAGDPGTAVIKPSGSEQTAAIISGEHIVTLEPDGSSRAGKLSYEPRLSWRRDNDPATSESLVIQLKGYIQTALLALSENRTGHDMSTGVTTHSADAPPEPSNLTKGLSSLN